LSMNKTRRILKKIMPMPGARIAALLRNTKWLPGDYLYSNQGNRILEVLEDDFEAQNGFMNASYSHRPYCDSGCEDIHQECTDDLHERLMEYGLSPPTIPLPWPLFATIQQSGIEYSCTPSDAGAELQINFQALQNVVLVVSSCSCSDHPQSKLHESNIHISSRLSSHAPVALHKDARKSTVASIF
jgi:uncharacterized protein YcgI (DUF1989 family)